MIRWCIVLGTGAAMSCGCVEPTGRSVVISPLPPPYYIPYVHDERPVTPTTMPAEDPDPTEAWYPDGPLFEAWGFIVIHHSATPYGSMREIDRAHRNNGWDSCGYHFVIGNGSRTPAGFIEPTPRWRRQIEGAHTRLSPKMARQSGVQPTYYNEHGIGVVLVGNFDEVRPSAAQMAAAAELTKFLMKLCRIPEDRVIGHRDVDATDCPGRLFWMDDLKQRVRALKWPTTMPVETASAHPSDRGLGRIGQGGFQ
ncbi:MAG: peptidoglycan recognition family protein [Phycisphaerae bacterium]|nr:peptidoglycan recognition family protein [Phycisphaerae bacterium]